MNRTTSRRTLILTAVVAVVAAIAAGVAVAAAPAKQTERAAWRACMTQNGVDFAGDKLPTLETARAALAACGLPWKKKVQTFVSCMRAHGGIASLTTALGGLGTDRLEKAAKQCGLDSDRIRSSLAERADRLATCMRKEGVAVPTATTGLRQALDGLLKTDRQTLADAWKACSSELRLTTLPGLPRGS
jgi:hypothetical protein